MSGLAFPDAVAQRIERCGIIAVLVIDDAAAAPDLARALLAGGVDVMELTLRTPAALGALARIRAEVPEMLAGIGTILTPDQVKQVVAAGAAFGVAPGTNRRVLEQAVESDLAFAPGIATPSDIETALEYGCRVLKLFPAEPMGGLSYLKAIAAPYAHLGIKYVPLGGLTAANMANYLAEPSITAIGGSWLAPRDAIRQADWQGITRKAAEARQVVDQSRKK